MKTQTIRKLLDKKIAEWIETIDDPVVKGLAGENVIVTGGCIASMLLGESVNDFDVYFRDRKTVMAVAEYYVRKFKENPPDSLTKNQGQINHMKVIDDNGKVKIDCRALNVKPNEEMTGYEKENEVPSVNKKEEIDNCSEYKPVFISANAITLSGKIQLIVRFYGEADEIHKNYDFVHCTNSWDSKSKELKLRKKALTALLTRELVYVGSKFPLCSIIRTRKFIARGFTINAGQYLKMAMQLNQLDLTDVDVLEDQLVGVDTAYFTELITKMREKGGKIDTAYLSTVINRMF